jgi:hypothetical protein
MNWEFFGGDGVRLYHYVGGDGAGFLAYLFGGEDIGEPAPTEIDARVVFGLGWVEVALLSHQEL